LDVDDTIVIIIREVTRIPPALKAWRTPVADLLSDNRFFNGNAEEAGKWKPVIKALFDTDKTAFPELLGKPSSPPAFSTLIEVHQPKSRPPLLPIFSLIENTSC
jgi:hypothetical protein